MSVEFLVSILLSLQVGCAVFRGVFGVLSSYVITSSRGSRGRRVQGSLGCGGRMSLEGRHVTCVTHVTHFTWRSRYLSDERHESVLTRTWPMSYICHVTITQPPPLHLLAAGGCHPGLHRCWHLKYYRVQIWKKLVNLLTRFYCHQVPLRNLIILFSLEIFNFFQWQNYEHYNFI